MLEPTAVILQVAFLAVLFLFVAWVVRSSLRDLRGPDSSRMVAGAPLSDATGIHSAETVGAGSAVDPRLIVERAPGHTPGMEYEIGEGAILGRGDQAEIRLDDPYASSRHARLSLQGGRVVLEDLGSTNGTYLDRSKVTTAVRVPIGTPVHVGKTVIELRP